MYYIWKIIMVIDFSKAIELDERPNQVRYLRGLTYFHKYLNDDQKT